jgi:hypothetical protein
MAFYRGQKVVCVRNGNTFLEMVSLWWHGAVRCPVGFVGTVGNVYFDDEEMLELVELPSPKAGPWCAGFRASAFRPLVDRTTDISVFHEILRKVTKRQGADA